MTKKRLTESEIRKKFNKYRRVIEILDQTPEIIPVVNKYYRLHYKLTRRRLGTTFIKVMSLLKYKVRSNEFFNLLDKYAPKRRYRKRRRK